MWVGMGMKGVMGGSMIVFNLITISFPQLVLAWNINLKTFWPNMRVYPLIIMMGWEVEW